MEQVLFILRVLTIVYIHIYIYALRARETGLTSMCRHGLLKLPNSAHPLSEHVF